jgi:hypothetical protein
MDVRFGTWTKNRLFSGNLKGRNKLGDPGFGGSIILK